MQDTANQKRLLHPGLILGPVVILLSIQLGLSIVHGELPSSLNFSQSQPQETVTEIYDAGSFFQVRDIAGVGDVNADGTEDFAVASPNSSESSGVFLFYGGVPKNGSVLIRDQSSSDRLNFVLIKGLENWTRSIQMVSIAGAGDVNGDGYADLLIGGDGKNDNVYAYVIYGTKERLGSNGIFDISLMSPKEGLWIVADRSKDSPINGYQAVVSGAGDINGDGFDDFAVGGSAYGGTYLIYGSGTGLGSSGVLDLENAKGQGNVFIPEQHYNFGIHYSVSGAGDVNGDGFDDLIIGTPFKRENRVHHSGGAFILYGSKAGLPSAEGEFRLAQITEGANPSLGTRLIGHADENTARRSGHSVGAAGDINGDSFGDVFVGAPTISGTASKVAQRGKAFVIFGAHKNQMPNTLTLHAPKLRENKGFTISGYSDYYKYVGASVSGAGDIDGDGLHDLLLSSIPSRGKANLIYGRENYGFPIRDHQGRATPSIFLSQPRTIGVFSPITATQVRMENFGEFPNVFGVWPVVSAAGDVDGDGWSDIVIGAGMVHKRSVFIVYGSGSHEEATYTSWMQGGEVPKEGESEPLEGGNAPLRGVGMIGDGSHSIPLSRVAIQFGGGGRGNSLTEPSLQTVTRFRERVPSPGPDWKSAGVHWKIETDRFKFKSSSITIYFTDKDIEDLNREKLDVYYSKDRPSPSTIWIPLQARFNYGDRQVTIERTHEVADAQEHFNGYYAILQADLEYTLGKEIPPPSWADMSKLDPDVGPSVTPRCTEGQTCPVFWHPGSRKLYAVNPGGVILNWPHPQSSNQSVPVTATLVWPEVMQIHVSGSYPVDLVGGGKFQAVQVMSSEPITGISDQDKGDIESSMKFQASGTGRTLLMLGEGPDLRQDLISFVAVNSVIWNDPEHVHAGVTALVGEPIIDSFDYHDDTCGSPSVLHKRSRYWAASAKYSGVYDRDKRSGSIIPVNEDNPSNPEDDLVVVYYQKVGDICWPYKPVQYVAKWPSSVPPIVIASTFGSGPLDLNRFKDLGVYRQPKESEPGFNPNEEHAQVFPSKGHIPRLLISNLSLTTIEGGAAEIYVSLSSPPAHNVTVAINPSYSLQKTQDETIVLKGSPDRERTPRTSESSQRLEFTSTNWQQPQAISFYAGLDEELKAKPSWREFEIIASGILHEPQKLTVYKVDNQIADVSLSSRRLIISRGYEGKILLQVNRTVLKEKGPIDVSVEFESGDEGIEIVGDTSWRFDTPVLNQGILAKEIRFKGVDSNSDSESETSTFTVKIRGGIEKDLKVNVNKTQPQDNDGVSVYALRNDLNTSTSSKPYVLVTYKDPHQGDKEKIKIYKVIAEQDPYIFSYQGTAGTLIQPPYPLTQLGKCLSPDILKGTSGFSGPYWKDHKGDFWARAAGLDGKPEQVVMRYFYPIQGTFDSGSADTTWQVGDCIPWLDQYGEGHTGIPTDITYNLEWPDSVPLLRTGETLMTPKAGLPDVLNQCSVEVIYQELLERSKGTKTSVKLIDPISPNRWTCKSSQETSRLINVGGKRFLAIYLLIFARESPTTKSTVVWNLLGSTILLASVSRHSCSMSSPSESVKS